MLKDTPKQTHCGSLGCPHYSFDNHILCMKCRGEVTEPETPTTGLSIADKYPKYYKAVNDKFIDVYGVHKLFNIQDPSGCIQHASKKLLLSGVRTGGKSAYDDIKEARDTLTRWLELNKP